MSQTNSLEEAVLRELIGVDTSVPPGRNYLEALKVAGERLEAAGFSVEYPVTPISVVKSRVRGNVVLEGERVNMVARIVRGESKRSLLLNAHIDVVPPGPNWSRDPFRLSVEGEKLFGRGASDNKGSVAAITAAATRLASSTGFEGELIVAFTCDEEIGGRSGLGYLVENGLKADAAIVGDGSIRTVGIAANGCMRFDVRVRGQAAHSSRNWLGVNAVEKAALVVDALAQLNRRLGERRSSVPADPDSGVDYLRPSLTVAMIRGGVKENVVPPLCEITVDRRLIPEETWEEAKAEVIGVLEALKSKDPKLDYEVEFEPQNHFSYKVSPNEEVVQLYASSWSRVMGREPLIVGGLGCVDACYLAAKGIPVVTGGVSRTGNNVHANDEFVLRSDIKSFSKIVELTALNYLKRA
jgi:succinyl-diaminopimelate desuccinylase